MNCIEYTQYVRPYSQCFTLQSRSQPVYTIKQQFAHTQWTLWIKKIASICIVNKSHHIIDLYTEILHFIDSA